MKRWKVTLEEHATGHKVTRTVTAANRRQAKREAMRGVVGAWVARGVHEVPK